MRFWFLGLFFSLLVVFPAYSQVEMSQPAAFDTAGEVPSHENLFAKEFYLNPDQRLKHETTDAKGFVFVDSINKRKNSRIAVVTDFGGHALKTRSVPNAQTIQDAHAWVTKTLEVAEFRGVEIKRLDFSVGEEAPQDRVYWVGHRSFGSGDEASRAIDELRQKVAFRGGDFNQMVADVATALHLPEEEVIVASPEPQFISEERLMLKYIDQMDIGEKLWGPFQGEPIGEPIIWQSFGETSTRLTNFEAKNFNSQVGFWTNRFVFQGIRAPLAPVNPFFETTNSIEAVGADFKSNIKLFAGLEWRPFARNPWLDNFQPWGGISILQWIKNYRFFLQYGIRENLKDEITGSDNHDLNVGVQIFYEWGVELPPLDERAPTKFSEYVEQYIWGEYFGNYRFELTNFGAQDDFDAWILNSSVILGFKMPGIPLPPNPINDHLELMPYVRFEHVNNTQFSFPFQNRHYVAAGVRVMPFRTYRWKESEWLSKTKLFIEYAGVGKTQHNKQLIDEPERRYDLRVGVSLSSRRF